MAKLWKLWILTLLCGISSCLFSNSHPDEAVLHNTFNVVGATFFIISFLIFIFIVIVCLPVEEDTHG